MKFLILLSIVFIGSINLIGCGSAKQSPLATDYVAPSLCPVNSGCADATPNKDAIILMGNSGQTFNIAADTARFDMGGKCSPSMFPNSYVGVQVINGSGVIQSHTTLDLVAGGIVPQETTTKTYYVQCKNGQYHFSISTLALATGRYTVKTSLIGLDELNKSFLNPSGEGDVVFYIQKQAPPPAQ